MFAPAGYVPFSEFFNNAFEESLYSEAENYLVETTKSMLSFAVQRRDDLVLRWVLEYCIDSLYVCSIGGKPLKVDGRQLFSHWFYVDLTGELLSELGGVELAAEIRRAFRMCDALGENAFDAFNQLVDEYRQADADCKAVENKITAMIRAGAQIEGLTRPPLFVNLVAGSIDLSLYRQLKKLDEVLERLTDEVAGLDALAQSLSQVEGWYLCLPESLYGPTWLDYCDERSEKHKKLMADLLANKTARRGRPRKRERAVEVFHELYPDGLEGHTWGMAARKVSSVTGEPVSVDTLRRGLKQK